ncbi:cytochrome c [Paenibacillus sp. GSMTC-2017]|uniref:c-type cytochrome n=1 Tax=Paenibacillus sp. GSMTC-2017 TaxID=2794350 RepID=UPI0018D9918D|nr:cytochrome c [Paenibacillus sp. GSMTC-2017]MBH5317633.1 cytochrome c [Paenibacillus sp. GSMTC-2017]
MFKWMMAIIAGLASLLAIYLLMFQLPPKEVKVPDTTEITIPQTTVDIAKAESVYKSNCMSCHGNEYQGTMGPALKQVGSKMSREAIYKKIVNGGGGMPGFEGRIEEQDIINITNWLVDFK